jgi:hypothetical protein
MTEPEPDVILTLTVREIHENGDAKWSKWSVDVWQAEGRTVAEFAQILRQIADGFESGQVKRIL